MMPIIRQLNGKMEQHLSKHALSGEMLELKHYMGKYSMDALASCAFGVDAGSLSRDDESDFIRYARKVFEPTVMTMIQFFFVLGIFTRNQVLNRCRTFLIRIGLGKLLEFPNKDANDFFINVLEATIKHRRETKTKRDDLVDMMIEALNDDGKPDECEQNEHEHDQFEKDSQLQNFTRPKTKLNDDYIIATAMVLMQAGFDTTALTMSNILYELTLNQECQKKLQEELSEVNLEDYIVLQNLPYLDAVIHETLRKNPVVPVIEKLCTKEYKIPRSNITIMPGETVQVNNVGICFDEKYFPNPEKFDPENFSKERQAERNPFTFLGFNQGPRSCIAMRFALLEMKICIANLLTKFNFLPCEKTKQNFEIEPKSFLGGIKGGAWVKCKKR